jgi:rSAM/selenodomain-associated transferase 1
MRSAQTRNGWRAGMTADRLPDVQPPALLIFAREPVAGEVKTRLAAALGTEAAATIYRELIDATFAYAVAARTQRIVADIELWCTPDPASPFFIALAARHGASRHAQDEGNLGDRMSAALVDALARAPAALLIGTDCPALGVAGLAVAAAALGRADVVLGPAEDGGFVLVGVRVPIRFDGVRWSTAHTLADTRESFKREGVRWVELPMCWDVDEPADLERWNAQRGKP